MYNNKRLFISIFWIILGALFFILSAKGILDKTFFSGFGGGLIAVGILQLTRNVKYRSNVEYKEKIDIEISDERAKFLRMKSWSLTGYIVVLIEAVGILVAKFLGQEMVMQVLCYSVCLIILIYYVTYIILKRKY